jgi:RNA polymerase sigma-70 factor, ECF subfamily
VVREANLQRAERRRAARDHREEQPGPATDPEIDLLKARYADDVKAALESTLADLPRDARNILRMHYLDELSIDQNASLHDVHRSTAARWIAEARRSILLETKRRLRARLRLTTSEASSLFALGRSELHVSLRALLSTRPTE